MWSLRFIVVGAVLAGTTLFGALAAHGTWWWNSNIDVEGTEVRTVWEVTDDQHHLYSYMADFLVMVPKDVRAVVVEQGSNETVTVRKSRKLQCLQDLMEVRVQGKVSALDGTTGTQAKITLTANGVPVGEKSGEVGSVIDQTVLVEAVCPDDDGGRPGKKK